METPEYITLVILGLASLIEISPIKINPWTWLGKTIGQAINGDLINEVNSLKKDVQGIKNSIDENEAKSARVRILRFGDELCDGKKPSKEHFDNILADITDYDIYCDAHKDFKNERTKMTEKFIKEQYQERFMSRKDD